MFNNDIFFPKKNYYYNLSNDFGLVSSSRVKRHVILAAFSNALKERTKEKKSELKN